jgi:hypothetical protein
MASRRSLQNIRRIMARALHSLSVATTTTAGNTLGTSVIATTLANAVSSNRYKHAWVMPVAGGSSGVLRRVRAEDALNLTTGELQVAPAFSAQIASGVEIEIHRLLPPRDDDGWSGLDSLINTALRELWTTDRLAVTGVQGQASYSLAAWEEWLDPQAVLEFRGQAAAAGLNAFPAGSFDSIRDADALTLAISPTLATGDAATLEVFRPGDTWIKVGATWALSTTGLVNETDECLFQPDLVVQVALVHAYESLASGPDGNRYEELARRQRFKANLLKTSLDHRQRQTHSGLMTGGYGWIDKSNPLGIG